MFGSLLNNKKVAVVCILLDTSQLYERLWSSIRAVDKQVDDKCITICVLHQVHLYRGDIYPKHADPRQQEKNIKRSTLFLTESKQIKNQQFEVTLPRNEI